MQTTPHTIGHWIDGTSHLGSSARVGDVTNPATGQVTAQVVFAGPEEIEAAVALSLIHI